ncbi:Conserved_hypothetical protein [Hexamita inflata]|uniref:EGF-like domain-containing protein n=1 Tax=Hexamita inflata TaxID=28002 RepID=A0AA86PKQ9_9EUKA|nr:Conserved hypothetical protein [Hexamita inflata]
MIDLPSFALFGFTSNILIQTSNISVKVPQQLKSGALVCLKCDVNATTSDFAFIVYGLNVSGFVQSLNSLIVVNNSLIQLRAYGFNVGGMLLNSTQATISLSSCNLSSFIDAKLSGSVIVFISDKISLTINCVRVCSNVMKFGIGLSNLSQIGNMIETCVVCKDSHYVYGLCQDRLEHGRIENDLIICANTFYFDGESCLCPNDYVLNGSLCIDNLSSITILKEKYQQSQQDVQNISNEVQILVQQTEQLILNAQYIQLQMDDLEYLFSAVQNHVAQNSSQIQYILESELSIITNSLQNNISIIENRILENTTEIKNIIIDVTTSLNTSESNLNSMNSTLQTQIFKNQDLKQSISTFAQGISTNNQIISQQQSILHNLSAKILCMNNRTSESNCPCYLGDNAAEWEGGICKCITGAKLVQGKCICTENAALVGKTCMCIPQFTILKVDKCVCTILNTILNNGSCKCTIPNTAISGDSCMCTIPYTIIQNGQCVCTPQYTVIQNNQCVCTIPDTYLMYNNIEQSSKCTCIIPSTHIEGGQCVCNVQYSKLIKYACTCPVGASIQVGACICTYPGTTIQNDKCVCTEDFTHYTARQNGGNFWCADKQQCCSQNDAGPSFTCSGNSEMSYVGCSKRTNYVT